MWTELTTTQPGKLWSGIFHSDPQNIDMMPNISTKIIVQPPRNIFRYAARAAAASFVLSRNPARREGAIASCIGFSSLDNEGVDIDEADIDGRLREAQRGRDGK